MKRSIALITAVGLLLVATPAAFAAKDRGANAPVEIQILNVSDWHGQLDPLGGVGGAAVLSTLWKQDRTAYPNTLTLTAGDAFGASPPLASFFDEEPAVKAMNMMGFTADTFGNHNFDKGTMHLQRMVDLAEFDFVSANLRNLESNLSGVDPWRLYHVGGVKVAVIGITNPEAPTLVFPGSFGSIEILDPAASRPVMPAWMSTITTDAPALRAIRVNLFAAAAGTPTGPLRDFAEKVENADLILGDHTDFQFEGVINGTLVLENRSKGLTYSKTLLKVDPRTKSVVSRSNEFVVPTAADVVPDPAIEAMLQPYRDQLTPILSGVVGSSDRYVPRSDSCGRSDSRLCESLVGNVVTDAMRVQTPGADFAVTNSGGLRDALTCPTTDSPTDFCPAYTPPPYPITRGQVRTVLPFGNILASALMNGAELKAYLEHGISAMPGANGRFPQVSGLCFTYDVSQPAGSRVLGAVRQADDGSCSGLPVSLLASSTYRVAINDFMANGGDGYPNVADKMATLNPLDAATMDYIAAKTPLQPRIQGRIMCTTTGTATCPAVTAP